MEVRKGEGKGEGSKLRGGGEGAKGEGEKGAVIKDDFTPKATKKSKNKKTKKNKKNKKNTNWSDPHSRHDKKCSGQRSTRRPSR